LAVGDSAIYTFKAVVDSLVQNGVAITNRANINANGLNQFVTAGNTPAGPPVSRVQQRLAVVYYGGQSVPVIQFSIPLK